MKKNSHANSGGKVGVSRRQWIKMAAGAVSTIPLAKGFSIAPFTAQAGTSPRQVSSGVGLSFNNAHTYMDYNAWRSLEAARQLLKTEPQRRWDDLSRRAECQLEVNKENRVEGSFDLYVSHYMQRMNESGVAVAAINTRDRELEGYSKTAYWKTLKRIAQVRDAYPGRFVLFAGIDPRRGKQGVRLLERAVKELGFNGMGEMLPHLHRFSPSDKQLCYPLYEKCVELGIPVTTNTWSSPGSALGFVYNPELFGNVCRDFPTLKICLSGAGMPYWSDSVLKLASTQETIYINSAGWQTEDEHCIPHYLQFLRQALSSGARYKIMYGGASSIHTYGVGPDDWMSYLVSVAPQYGFEFTEEELHLYFAENFKNYFNSARG
jgi:predicted TIM-barrel fold metal-dependent hydrolase